MECTEDLVAGRLTDIVVTTKEMKVIKPKYYTWIRKSRVATFAIVSALLLIIVTLWLNTVVSIIAFVLAVPFIYLTFILSYTYYQFSEHGGNYQGQIHDTILAQITVKSGKLLDIGSGSGSLIIKTAKKLSNVVAVGVDSWRTDWNDYSKKLCEINAEIEGVSDRITFFQGSAANLPFGNDEFDIVTSCLTFHEVKDTPDKEVLLCEALRVLKHGGEFIFLDLFESEKVFGKLSSLVASLDVSRIEAKRLGEIIPLPKLLHIKQCLGYAVIIKGIK